MTDTKVVLITGAAARIGAEIARCFHRAGLRVLVHYHRSAQQADAVVNALNDSRADSARSLQADLCAPAQVESLAADALAAFGRLDVLVNNASAFYPTHFGESTQDQWDELIGSNLRGAYFLSQALKQALTDTQGSILNIADVHADQALAGHAIYSIAKAGLKAMTYALARELAPEVRVNAVSPGAILWPAALADDDDPSVQATRQRILDAVPLGVSGEPSHIADTALFLACQASYVTGQVIRVDGGRHLS